MNTQARHKHCRAIRCVSSGIVRRRKAFGRYPLLPSTEASRLDAMCDQLRWITSHP